MKKLMAAAVLLTACFKDPPVTDPYHNEAAEVALECLERMSQCTEWEPVRINSNLSAPEPKDCDKYDGQWCNDRNDEAQALWEKRRSRTHASPCQIQVESCVDMVAAVARGKPEVHNHYRKH